MTGPSLLFCATEISGDHRGARLARELRQAAPALRLYGLGGERMRAAGVEVAVDVTDRGTIGWFDHWRDLPAFLSALACWKREIRERRPSAAIVIDAPGISFPFARVARSAGLRVVYFVTPQTWLWNRARAVERLRASVDLVVPSLAEEAAIYASAGLPVVYEGHPALDDLVDTYDGSAWLKPRPAGAPAGVGQGFGLAGPLTIGLVPGSRRHAIRRLLPVMLEAAEQIEARTGPARVLVSVASAALRSAVGRGLVPAVTARLQTRPALERDLPALLRASDVVLAATGSNLLDAVFAGAPVVACYRIDAITHAIAKHAMRLPGRIRSFALPNLIAGEEVVPELIQGATTADALADAAVRLLTDEGARERMRHGYAKVRGLLGEPGVNARIARRILAELRIET